MSVVTDSLDMPLGLPLMWWLRLLLILLRIGAQVLVKLAGSGSDRRQRICQGIRCASGPCSIRGSLESSQHVTAVFDGQGRGGEPIRMGLLWLCTSALVMDTCCVETPSSAGSGPGAAETEDHP